MIQVHVDHCLRKLNETGRLMLIGHVSLLQEYCKWEPDSLDLALGFWYFSYI